LALNSRRSTGPRPRSSGFFLGAAASAGCGPRGGCWPAAAGFLIASFCGANGTGETVAALVAGGGEASVTGGLSDSAATLAGSAEVETARESLGAGAGTCAVTGGGAIGCAPAATGGGLG
jgi:hypothetical protein